MKKILYIKSIFYILLLTMAVSCKVSKDLPISNQDLPESYRELTPQGSSIGTLPWKSFFKGTELQDLITDAIAHNNDLQVAIKDIEIADLSLRQAKLGNVPTISLGASAITNNPSENGLTGLQIGQFNKTYLETYSINASLSWEADIWGKIHSRKAEALAQYLQTSEARKAIQTRLVSDVAKGYYNLLALDEQLRIAKSNSDLASNTLRIIRIQFDAGQVTSLAVEQADAQKLTADDLVPMFEQQVAVQENALSILTGRMPQNIMRDGILEAQVSTNEFSAGVPTEILSRRPDIKIAEFELAKSNSAVGYTKAAMYPSLTITAQAGLESIKTSNWFNIPASLFGLVAGSILQPVFQQRKLRTQYNIAQVNRDKNVIRFRQAVLIGVAEVSDNLAAIGKLDSRRKITTQKVEGLERAINNAQSLFSNGVATYLEVLTAQSNALQNQLELTNIKKAQLYANVDLFRALGGGWE
jgi:NodT family efflux transporter outer membrane factor (OMF) lipoprotein